MKNVIINSLLAFTAAYLATILLHELAHYLMSLALGFEATLYHNRVFTAKQGGMTQEILIAGAGPVFSLLQGWIAYRIATRRPASPSTLFLLWFGLAGIITFFGYLMIAPLIPVGDTGRIFTLLGVPIIVQIVVAISAIALVTLILVRATPHFERFVTRDFGSLKATRRKWSMSLILFPLLIGILMITLLQFPIPHVASILATVCGPFAIMAVFGTFIGKKDPIAVFDAPVIANRISGGLIGVLVLTIIINRVLVTGFSL